MKAERGCDGIDRPVDSEGGLSLVTEVMPSQSMVTPIEDVSPVEDQ